MSQLAFKVTGMVCAGCSDTVQKVVTAIDGVSSANVNWETGAAALEVGASVDPGAVYTAIRDAGFGVATCGNPACKCSNCHCDPCQCN